MREGKDSLNELMKTFTPKLSPYQKEMREDNKF